MLSVSSKLLSLSGEAALLVRGGKIVYANPRAEKLLGESCLGKTLRELFGDEIAEAQARVFSADTTAAGRRVYLRTAKLDDMQVLYLSECALSQTPVNDAFLYAMRSALMNLRLSEELCRARAEKLGDGELAEDLRAMRRGLFRITRLIDNASLVRSAAAGELKANACVLDLAALCRMIVESVSLLRQDLNFRLFAEGELCLLGDRVLIEQMILNLLSNCLLHAEGLSRVTLRITPTPTQLILSVSDDGCGIGEDEMAGVFERYRDSFELGALGGGAGLGLSVVRSVASLHDGTLMLESRPGVGTAARVSLARRLSPGKLAAPELEPPADMGRLLAGLADCLDPDCFDGKMMD